MTEKLANLILNPNYFLLKHGRQKIVDLKLDLRASRNFRLLGRKLIYYLRAVFLLGLDSMAVILSWWLVDRLSSIASDRFWSSGQIAPNQNLAITIAMINLFIFMAAGMYGTRDTSRKLKNSIRAITLTYGASLGVWLWGGNAYPDSNLVWSTWLLAWISNLLITCGGRWLLFDTINLIRHNFAPLRRKILLVGNTRDVEQYQLLLQQNRSFKICSAIKLDELDSQDYFQSIWQQFASQSIDEIFICSWNKINGQTKLFWNLQTSGISWRILPINRAIPQQNPEFNYISGVPTIRYSNSAIAGLDFWLKRGFDLLLSSILLILLSIPMLAIALLIKLDSPGAIFYRQTRVGLKGKEFQVWKFRTMVANASQLQAKLEAQNEVNGGILFKMKDDPRITKVGKFLRKFSLDELPQLFNVLWGEMSLVGPRPLPTRDVAKFQPKHHFRHEVLPGITGLWQVSGRSDTDSENVFNLDFEYIKNWSLTLDFKILLQTAIVVINSKGAY